MKLPVLCAVALFAAAAASQAGSFGGPPPFTDLSPLQSGIDGAYQAVCRGKNTSGIIRFQYAAGQQTPAGSGNTYSFFVEGNTVSGAVTAAINGKNLDGVLEGQSFSVPTNDEGSANLPLVFIVRGNRANGEFSGRMDLEDRMSFFSGDGTIGPATAEQNTVIGVNTNNDDNFGGFIVVSDTNGNSTPVGTAIQIVVTNFIVPGSTIPVVDFEFTGVRTAIQAGPQVVDTNAAGGGQ